MSKNFEMRTCKLASIPTEDAITGQDMCNPRKPARLSMDKMKLHYVVHYTFRGWWDYLVPKEKEEERGLIETYQCLMCPRRFRNNHNKKQYPGRGSMVCHLATEHGQLLKAMRADTEMDMQSEIEALDKFDQGKFLEMGIPDVPDNELYVAKESYMWKFEQSQLKEKQNQEANSDPNQPKIIPKSNTELAEMRNNNYSRGRQVYEMHKCAQAPIPTPDKIQGQDMCSPKRPATLPMDKIKLHYVVHYTFRGWWDYLVPKEKEEELGKIETYECLLCKRRFRNNHNKKQYPGRGSMVCHLATEHGQLLKAMRADTEVDMTEEIEAINKHENGKFLEMGIPDVEDNEFYIAKESYMWKFENEDKLKGQSEKKEEPKRIEHKEPVIVPLSKTELAEREAERKAQEKEAREREAKEKEAKEKERTAKEKKADEAKKIPEPTRGKRNKPTVSKPNSKWRQWMSDDEMEDDEEEIIDETPQAKKSKTSVSLRKGKK